jgi:NAD(P)-dependent dehydrogenase (short-subunit alcohol dehydrogenase family)
MNGKIVLITGAKGGLGTDVTKAFLGEGATVIGVSRSIKQADFPSPNFTAYPVDITQSQPTRELVEQIVSKHGRIDVLVNVAGGFAASPVHATDDEGWNHLLSLNLSSAFYVAREVVKSMRQTGGGRLIAIGSLAAVEPHAGLGAYVATKTALHVLYRTIALENRDKNITANVILPGTMDTPANRAAMPKVDPAKWMPPAEVARVALLLAQEEAAPINGALIPVSRDE